MKEYVNYCSSFKIELTGAYFTNTENQVVRSIVFMQLQKIKVFDFAQSLNLTRYVHWQKRNIINEHFFSSSERLYLFNICIFFTEQTYQF